MADPIPVKPQRSVTITEADVRRAVADLFTDGVGKKVNRLVLTTAWDSDRGGYCEEAMVARLCRLLGLEK